MWSRVDDGVPSHPKFLRAGPVASWLWICGICYCNKHLTDGFIPEAALPMIGTIPDLQKEVDTLVKVCLWEKTDGGFQVHDFHDHNDTREEALARQDVRSEQRRKAGIASGVSRRTRSNETRTARSNEEGTARSNETRTAPLNETRTTGVEPHPIPSHPIPTDPDVEEKQGLPVIHLSSADADFELFRLAYPVSRRVGGKKAKSAWKAATHGRNGTHFAAMMDALEKHKQSLQWNGPDPKIPLLTTWLNEERWNQELPAMRGLSTEASARLDSRLTPFEKLRRAGLK